MNFLSLCHTVDELASHADELPRVDDLLTMLQQCFITVFKPAEPNVEAGGGEPGSSTTQPTTSSSRDDASASSFASDEEERLTVVHAVRVFHERGAVGHRAFFTKAEYHPHAALFIHGLLQSLGGHSRLWFRTLQLACVETCSAILRAIGVGNVRLCLPGVISAAARYLNRAHTRTDSVRVKVAVIDLLRETLCSVLTMPATGSADDGAAWAGDTIAHLGGVMHVVLSPDAVLKNAQDARTAVTLKRLTLELLTTPCLLEHTATPFAKDLIVAYTLASNLVDLEFGASLGGTIPTTTAATTTAASSSGPHISTSDQSTQLLSLSAHPQQMETLSEERPGAAWATLHLPNTCWDISGFVEAVVEALCEQRGAALLHIASTALCTAALREKVLTREPARLQMFASVVRKCVRLVGTEMPLESLYESREANCPAVARLVDHFLACCAHACSLLPSPDEASALGDDDDADDTAGEALTNLLLDEYEAMLQDWDLYMAHPPVLYVVTRLVLWQFKPLTGPLLSRFVGHKSIQQLFPTPPQFMTSHAFENLWSVVAQPHLWSITEDENLCSFQQIHHRHVVAATLLRFLGLAARDVLAPALAYYGDEGAYSWERFRTLTLYLVLEKEAISGPVHDAASACLRAYASASGAATALAFFLGASHVVLEEASRAVRETFLRPSVASVLRGMVDLIVASTLSPTTSTTRVVASSTQLAVLARQRLSVAEAEAAVRRHCGLSEEELPKVAVCLAGAIRIATESCQLARRAGDEAGMKGALILLRDCLDVAALVNFSAPLLPEDEDHERQTTSGDPNVQQLQIGVLAALQVVLTNCMSHSHGTCVPFAVQAAIRALTAFVDTEECATWAERQRAAIVEAVATRRAEKAAERGKSRLPSGLEDDEDDADDADVDVDRAMQFLPLPAMPWPWTRLERVDTAGREAEAAACAAERQHLVLPRSHLKTVYRVYLSLVALLKEPVAAFHTAAARPGRRGPAERRALEAVRITPSIFTVLDALESLWELVGDFMSARAVDEVLPLALVWYERASLPRIPTDTEVRLGHAVKRFTQRLAKVVERDEQKTAVAAACQSFFTLSPPDATERDALAADHDAMTTSPVMRETTDNSPKREVRAVEDLDVYVPVPLTGSPPLSDVDHKSQ